MKKILTILAAALVGLSSCSKTEPEKEPSEQVIGTYTIDSYSLGVKYDKSPTTNSSTINFPFKANNGTEFTANFSIAKLSSNTITITYNEIAKPTTGASTTDKSPYGDYELRKVDISPSGQFDLYDVTTATKSGIIGNNSILIEEQFPGQDSLGKYTASIRFSGKKTN